LTARPMKFYSGLVSGSGDTIVAYWDGSTVGEHCALAIMVFLITSASMQPDLICYATRILPQCTELERDLMSLYFLHDLILAGLGVKLSTELGMFNL
jgi:hypothetical protein